MAKSKKPHPLVGLTIVKLRQVTAAEREASGVYDQRTQVIELSDGTCILALRDDEGNGFGTLLHVAPDRDDRETLTGYYL